MEEKPIKTGSFRKFFNKIVNRSKTVDAIAQNQVQVVTMPFGQAFGEKSKAVLGNDVENNNRWDEYLEDPEILKLQLIMMDRAPQNIRWVFNHETACATGCFMLSQAIKGSSGLTIKTKNNKIHDYLIEYHNKINISKIIEKAMKDNLCFADSVWWKDYDTEQGIIIPRNIDYLTLTPISNKFTGAKKWVQVTYVDQNLPENNGAKWKSYEPYVDYFHLSQFMQESPKDRLVKRHIFQEDVLNFNFFSSPPMLGVVDICLWKKWMQYDAQLGGKKYAMPTLDATVTLPEGINISDEETRNLMDQISADLNRMMNFGVLSHPDSVKVQPLATANNTFDFTHYLEYAEKQIHKGILVPANLLEATGTELATSRTTKDMFVIGIRSLRTMFADIIKQLDLEQLEFAGIKAKWSDFELLFSVDDTQQQLTQNEEFMAIMQLFDRGIMKDENEVRNYVAKFGMELPQLSKKELELQQQEAMKQQLLASGDMMPSLDELGIEKDIEQDITGSNNDDK